MRTAVASEIAMPRLTDSMEEGTILRWLKSAGDAVAVGDELVEIETDKATMAYEADVAGTLLELLAGAGDAVAVGAPIARVGDPDAAPEAPGDGADRAADSGGAPTEERPVAADAPASAQQVAPRVDSARAKASPLARRVARERGIDLMQLTGTGPRGRIVKADVEAAATAAPEAPAAVPPEGASPGAVDGGKGAVEVVEPSRLQLARRMAESKATIPHIHLTTEIDMSRCIAAREGLKQMSHDEESVPSYNDMVVKAAALALRTFPRANGSWSNDRFELYSRVNVGVAVAATDTLVVPTVFDADRKGLSEIAAETRRLAARVREGATTPPELAGGTFTVSNLGMYGVDSFEAVINPPQAAMLAVGAIVERPVARDGELTVAPVAKATLACDHRILYGADGAALLARIRALLEEPIALAG